MWPVRISPVLGTDKMLTISLTTRVLGQHGSRRSATKLLHTHTHIHIYTRTCVQSRAMLNPASPIVIIIINRSLSVTFLFLWVSAKLFCFVLSEALTQTKTKVQIFHHRSQVCLGRPGCRLQFLGAGDMQACRAREWSWDLTVRATWPNNFKQLRLVAAR